MEGSRADAKHIADELCQAYLSHSLTRRGYSDAIPRTMIAACLSADVSRVFKFLQPLADSFEDLAPDVFHDLIPCLHITARTAYKLFDHLALEIFADGVNWGKIAALYALAGAVAVECVRRNWKRGVRSVYVCFSTFIREHLLEWIVDHDGWNGFMEWSGRRQQRGNDHFWTFAKIVGLVVLGGILLAAFAFGK